MREIKSPNFLVISLFFFLVVFSCKEQEYRPQSSKTVQAELDAFVKAEMKNSKKSIMPKMIEFLIEKGFKKVHPNTKEYKEIMKKYQTDAIQSNTLLDIKDSKNARTLACDVQTSSVLHTGECFVIVREYFGCKMIAPGRHCVSNTWYCPSCCNWGGELPCRCGETFYC